MNFLKHSLIAVSLAAAAGTAMAQPVQATPKLADPATMTTDEKATVKLLQDFRACGREVKQANDAKIATIDAAAKTVATVRGAVADKMTREALSRAGVAAADIKTIMDSFAEADAYNVAEVMKEKQLQDPQSTCLTKLNITDPDKTSAEISAIARKYGRDVLAPKQP